MPRLRLPDAIHPSRRHGKNTKRTFLDWPAGFSLHHGASFTRQHTLRPACGAALDVTPITEGLHESHLNHEQLLSLCPGRVASICLYCSPFWQSSSNVLRFSASNLLPIDAASLRGLHESRQHCFWESLGIYQPSCPQLTPSCQLAIVA